MPFFTVHGHGVAAIELSELSVQEGEKRPLLNFDLKMEDNEKAMRMLPFHSRFEGKRYTRKLPKDDFYYPPEGHCSVEWKREENGAVGQVEYLFFGEIYIPANHAQCKQ